MIPAMLHATVESRNVAQKWYKLSVTNIYFDPSRDYLYVQCRCRGQMCQRPEHCAIRFVKQLEGFASRIIYELDDQQVLTVMFGLIFYAPNAEEVLFVDTKKGLGNLVEGKISDFTCDPKPYEVLDVSGLSLLEFHESWIIRSTTTHDGPYSTHLRRMACIQLKDKGEDKDEGFGSRALSIALYASVLSLGYVLGTLLV